jgi:hypothetical protein
MRFISYSFLLGVEEISVTHSLAIGFVILLYLSLMLK